MKRKNTNGTKVPERSPYLRLLELLNMKLSRKEVKEVSGYDVSCVQHRKVVILWIRGFLQHYLFLLILYAKGRKIYIKSFLAEIKSPDLII